jgi:hypothetical protein
MSGEAERKRAAEYVLQLRAEQRKQLEAHEAKIAPARPIVKGQTLPTPELLRHLAVAKRKPTGHRRFCRKRKCRNEHRRNPALFAAPGSNLGLGTRSVKLGLRNPIESGIKTGHESGRAWRIVAGPPPSEATLRAATVPDGPDCRWKGGSVERIEANSRQLLESIEDDIGVPVRQGSGDGTKRRAHRHRDIFPARRQLERTARRNGA